MKIKTILLSILLIFLCLGASFRPFGCKTTTTSGKVTAFDTGSPLQGAAVTISDYDTFTSSTTTNENGVYTFEDVPYGLCEIEVTCNGYVSKIQEINTSYFETGLACRDIEGKNIQLITEGEEEKEQSYSWQELGAYSAYGGGISNNTGISYYPSIAINGSGNPVVAWHDDTSGDSEIYLKQWNGSSWEEMGMSSASGGGISNNTGISYYPSIAINGSGNHVVAWRDDTSGDDEIYIKQWSGSSWEEMV